MGMFTLIGLIFFAVFLVGLVIYVLHIAQVNAKEQLELERKQRLEQQNNINIQQQSLNIVTQSNLESTTRVKENIFSKSLKEPQTSAILKGVAGELVFSLVGILIWVVMYQVGYLVGLFGILVMGLILMGWKWFKRKKLPSAAFYGAGIIGSFAILSGEFLALIVECMIKQKASFADSFVHTINWFKAGNIGLTILVDLGIGFLTASLTMIGFILYQKYNRAYRNLN